ncbi:hypothetical protein K435DRAFT_870410 [Dendrothele bispora CBS 962.96]|uniref:Uncharacterized protein n=1 Tax=Dendrothele bispora (strain CBS 962.96) TaxID=1314807 RepID=A0A4S8L6L7_DENBC|nr:hypothetical protein K435DRAFT_870410 [Dendrothele bispora CBS 962.96]
MHDDALLPFSKPLTPPPLLYDSTSSESESNDDNISLSDSNSSDASIKEDNDRIITVELEAIDVSDWDNEEELRSSDVPGSDDDIGCSSSDMEDTAQPATVVGSVFRGAVCVDCIIGSGITCEDSGDEIGDRTGDEGSIGESGSELFAFDANPFLVAFCFPYLLDFFSVPRRPFSFSLLSQMQA